MLELTDLQKKVLDFLSKSDLKNSFYWTGGTLLSTHYLHHRKSLDIDLFSDNPVPFEKINAFVQDFAKKYSCTIADQKRIFDRWEFLIKKGGEDLRAEFVHYNHDKKALRPKKEHLGIFIDSLDDIAANKTMAYFDRNEPKDLFDIYFLIKKAKFTPQKLLKLVHHKFGAKFSPETFWSESFKGLKLLRSLEPLMEGKSGDEKEKLFDEIEDYFKSGSRKYLNYLMV